MPSALQHIAEKLGIPQTVAEFMLSDWEFIDFPTFEVMVKGNEVHLLAKGTFLPRRGFADVFGPLLNRYGRVATTCLASDTASRTFIERIGFTRTHLENGVMYYQISHIPYQRRPTCL